MEYTFHYGDFVEGVNGDVGYLTNINGKTEERCCTNNDDFVSFSVNVCLKNMTWHYNNSVRDIPKYFRRIGRYSFSTWRESIKDESISKIERLDNGVYYTGGAYYTKEILDKINQLVDAVNKMNER